MFWVVYDFLQKIVFCVVEKISKKNSNFKIQTYCYARMSF